MLLDGKLVSSYIKENIKKNILENNLNPKLIIIQVGNNDASNIYIRNKIKACSEVGIVGVHVKLDEAITQEALLAEIKKYNEDDSVDGIIVQLPLPHQLDETLVINAVRNDKDVDGFSIINKGKMFTSNALFTPATPTGIMSLLDYYHIEIAGKRAVVVGRSNIVGKPMAIMLLNKNATVTIAHSKTVDLPSVCKEADILVCAVGRAKMFDSTYIKDGAVVVDVGMNRDENNKLCGDVDFEDVVNKVSYITPVPGGVGPLTIATLLENTYKACINKTNK